MKVALHLVRRSWTVVVALVAAGMLMALATWSFPSTASAIGSAAGATGGSSDSGSDPGSTGSGGVGSAAGATGDGGTGSSGGSGSGTGSAGDSGAGSGSGSDSGGSGSAGGATGGDSDSGAGGIGSASGQAPDQGDSGAGGIGSASGQAPDAPQPPAPEPIDLGELRYNRWAQQRLISFAERWATLQRGKFVIEELAGTRSPRVPVPPFMPTPGTSPLGQGIGRGAGDAIDLAMAHAVATSLQNGQVVGESYQLSQSLQDRGVPEDVADATADRLVGDIADRLAADPYSPGATVQDSLAVRGDFPATQDVEGPTTQDVDGVGGIGSAAGTAPGEGEPESGDVDGVGGIGSATGAAPDGAIESGTGEDESGAGEDESDPGEDSGDEAGGGDGDDVDRPEPFVGGEEDPVTVVDDEDLAYVVERFFGQDSSETAEETPGPCTELATVRICQSADSWSVVDTDDNTGSTEAGSDEVPFAELYEGLVAGTGDQ